MRTVFTDGQTKRLEALFELTDYPTVEARADVARSTGLSEETVRVSPTRRFSQMFVIKAGERWSCVKPLQLAFTHDAQFLANQFCLFVYLLREIIL